MKKLSLIFFAFAALLIVYSCEKKSENQETAKQDTMPKAEEKKGLSDKEKDFIKEAANNGMLEVQLGKLANEKGMSKDVKEFGHHMVMDHDKANKELKQLAMQKNVMIPDSLDDDGKDKVKNLSTAKGKDFDKKYMKSMVDDHKDAVEDFEDIAKNSEDADLKALAEKTLPTLREHYMKAQMIDSTLNASKKK
ncbi:MAG: DUF4142 domain-containing protein [Cytophagaceae bacterium]|nr:DUF4142 domain-containing protein [Cytophagaceae bacterium]